MISDLSSRASACRMPHDELRDARREAAGADNSATCNGLSRLSWLWTKLSELQGIEADVRKRCGQRMASASIPNTEKTSGLRSKLNSWVSRTARPTFSHTSDSRARRGKSGPGPVCPELRAPSSAPACRRKPAAPRGRCRRANRQARASLSDRVAATPAARPRSCAAGRASSPPSSISARATLPSARAGGFLQRLVVGTCVPVASADGLHDIVFVQRTQQQFAAARLDGRQAPAPARC